MPADVSELRRVYGRYARRVFDDATQSMLREAEVAAPVDTGETARSGKIIARAQSETHQSAKVRFPTPQAGFTNDGTRPHVIRPRTARVLRFRAGGRVVYAAKVNHPGTRATRWFDNVMTDARWAEMVRRAAGRVPFT